MFAGRQKGKVRSTMFSLRDLAKRAAALLGRDSRAIGFSFWLIYNPVVLGLLVWTAIDPESSLSFIPRSGEVSAASHLVGEFAVVNALLVPFGFYVSLMQKSFELDATSHSLGVPRILPIDTEVKEERQVQPHGALQALRKDAADLCGARVFSCCSLSLISVLPVYLTYLCFHQVGGLREDDLTPVLLGGRFPLFIISLTLLTSAFAVGVGYIAGRKWSVAIAVVVVLAIWLLGVISDAAQGRHDRQFFVKLLAAYGSRLTTSFGLLGLALLIAWLLKERFRARRA